MWHRCITWWGIWQYQKFLLHTHTCRYSMKVTISLLSYGHYYCVQIPRAHNLHSHACTNRMKIRDTMLSLVRRCRCCVPYTFFTIPIWAEKCLRTWRAVVMVPWWWCRPACYVTYLFFTANNNLLGRVHNFFQTNTQTRRDEAPT